ncbi:hypothetical protein PGT21_019832 [Puccinia graminis f. sp. tritici]|uniref:TNFR-Cys domain-containing protein n=1 Tax=Puccinia graminis f. sp. tritici TaxID=56615 RepID=A0A5B0LXS7_PUCGR|nr:hypothetical protein PGT21_019832 [Puccinia graminis f. sp. tritici]
MSRASWRVTMVVFLLAFAVVFTNSSLDPVSCGVCGETSNLILTDAHRYCPETRGCNLHQCQNLRQGTQIICKSCSDPTPQLIWKDCSVNHKFDKCPTCRLWDIARASVPQSKRRGALLLDNLLDGFLLPRE